MRLIFKKITVWFFLKIILYIIIITFTVLEANRLGTFRGRFDVQVAYRKLSRRISFRIWALKVVYGVFDRGGRGRIGSKQQCI